MNKSNGLRNVVIIVAIGLFMLFTIKMAIYTSRRDAAFIKESVSDSNMVKAGKTTRKVSDEFKNKRKNFMKGYNDTIKEK